MADSEGRKQGRAKSKGYKTCSKRELAGLQETDSHWQVVEPIMDSKLRQKTRANSVGETSQPHKQPSQPATPASSTASAPSSVPSATVRQSARQVKRESRMISSSASSSPVEKKRSRLARDSSSVQQGQSLLGKRRVRSVSAGSSPETKTRKSEPVPSTSGKAEKGKPVGYVSRRVSRRTSDTASVSSERGKTFDCLKIEALAALELEQHSRSGTQSPSPSRSSSRRKATEAASSAAASKDPSESASSEHGQARLSVNDDKSESERSTADEKNQRKEKRQARRSQRKGTQKGIRSLWSTRSRRGITRSKSNEDRRSKRGRQTSRALQTGSERQGNEQASESKAKPSGVLRSSRVESMRGRGRGRGRRRLQPKLLEGSTGLFMKKRLSLQVGSSKTGLRSQSSIVTRHGTVQPKRKVNRFSSEFDLLNESDLKKQLREASLSELGDGQDSDTPPASHPSSVEPVKKSDSKVSASAPKEKADSGCQVEEDELSEVDSDSDEIPMKEAWVKKKPAPNRKSVFATTAVPGPSQPKVVLEKPLPGSCGVHVSGHTGIKVKISTVSSSGRQACRASTVVTPAEGPSHKESVEYHPKADKDLQASFRVESMKTNSPVKGKVDKSPKEKSRERKHSGAEKSKPEEWQAVRMSKEGHVAMTLKRKSSVDVDPGIAAEVTLHSESKLSEPPHIVVEPPAGEEVRSDIIPQDSPSSGSLDEGQACLKKVSAELRTLQVMGKSADVSQLSEAQKISSVGAEKQPDDSPPVDSQSHDIACADSEAVESCGDPAEEAEYMEGEGDDVILNLQIGGNPWSSDHSYSKLDDENEEPETQEESVEPDFVAVEGDELTSTQSSQDEGPTHAPEDISTSYEVPRKVMALISSIWRKEEPLQRKSASRTDKMAVDCPVPFTDGTSVAGPTPADQCASDVSNATADPLTETATSSPSVEFEPPESSVTAQARADTEQPEASKKSVDQDVDKPGAKDITPADDGAELAAEQKIASKEALLSKTEIGFQHSAEATVTSSEVANTSSDQQEKVADLTSTESESAKPSSTVGLTLGESSSESITSPATVDTTNTKPHISDNDKQETQTAETDSSCGVDGTSEDEPSSQLQTEISPVALHAAVKELESGQHEAMPPPAAKPGSSKPLVTVAEGKKEKDDIGTPDVAESSLYSSPADTMPPVKPPLLSVPVLARFEFRQKVSRSPIQLLAMKDKKEEEVYEMEEAVKLQKRMKRKRGPRGPKKFLAEEQSDSQLSEAEVVPENSPIELVTKPCSVKLIDVHKHPKFLTKVAEGLKCDLREHMQAAASTPEGSVPHEITMKIPEVKQTAPKINFASTFEDFLRGKTGPPIVEKKRRGRPPKRKPQIDIPTPPAESITALSQETASSGLLPDVSPVGKDAASPAPAEDMAEGLMSTVAPELPSTIIPAEAPTAPSLEIEPTLLGNQSLSPHSTEVRFQCNRCDFSSYSRQMIECHIYRHLPEVSFKCGHCQMQFTSRAAVLAHKKQHKGPQKILKSCEVKEEDHYIVEEVQRSPAVPKADWLMMSDASKRFNCTHCRYSTDVKEDVEQHVKDLHSGAHVYCCRFCEDVYCNTEADIQKHCAEKHSSLGSTYKILPNFSDMNHLALKSSSKENDKNIFERLNTMITDGNAPDPPNPQYQRARRYMAVIETNLKKTSAEADSTTSGDMVTESTPASHTEDENEDTDRDTSDVGREDRSDDSKKDSPADDLVGKSPDKSGPAGEQPAVPEGPSPGTGESRMQSSSEQTESMTKGEDGALFTSENSDSDTLGIKIVEVVSLRDKFPEASGSSPESAWSVVPGLSPGPAKPAGKSGKPHTSESEAPFEVDVDAIVARNERVACTYKCSSCNVHSPHLKTIKMHLKEFHSNEKLFTCPYCRLNPSSLKTGSEEEVLNHIREFHPSNYAKREVDLSELSKTMIQVVTLSPGKDCPYVGRKFIIEKDIFCCQKCGSHFPSLDATYRHMEQDHAEAFYYVCPICKTYKGKSEMIVTKHIAEDHKRSVSDELLSLAVEDNIYVRVAILQEKNKQGPQRGAQQEEDILIVGESQLRSMSSSTASGMPVNQAQQRSSVERGRGRKPRGRKVTISGSREAGQMIETFSNKAASVFPSMTGPGRSASVPNAATLPDRSALGVSSPVILAPVNVMVTMASQTGAPILSMVPSPLAQPPAYPLVSSLPSALRAGIASSVSQGQISGTLMSAGPLTSSAVTSAQVARMGMAENVQRLNAGASMPGRSSNVPPLPPPLVSLTTNQAGILPQGTSSGTTWSVPLSNYGAPPRLHQAPGISVPPNSTARGSGSIAESAAAFQHSKSQSPIRHGGASSSPQMPRLVPSPAVPQFPSSNPAASSRPLSANLSVPQRSSPHAVGMQPPAAHQARTSGVTDDDASPEAFQIFNIKPKTQASLPPPPLMAPRSSLMSSMSVKALLMQNQKRQQQLHPKEPQLQLPMPGPRYVVPRTVGGLAVPTQPQMLNTREPAKVTGASSGQASRSAVVQGQSGKQTSQPPGAQSSVPVQPQVVPSFFPVPSSVVGFIQGYPIGGVGIPLSLAQTTPSSSSIPQSHAGSMPLQPSVPSVTTASATTTATSAISQQASPSRQLQCPYCPAGTVVNPDEVMRHFNELHKGKDIYFRTGDVSRS